MFRQWLCSAMGVLVLAAAASAQLVDEFNPPPSGCCLSMSAHRLAAQLDDWNQLGRYHQANKELKAQPVEPGRVVFYGDSITDVWKLAESFPGKPYVNRGIGGQTTSQMLGRMYADVIELKPRAVILLAGTNDIARNTGPMTATMIQQNIKAITELAKHNGIKVILCSILPVSDYPFERSQKSLSPDPKTPMRNVSQKTNGRPPSDILKMNAWLKSYASEVGAIYVDYFGPMVDEKGWLKDGYAEDGLHPNAEGYRIMAPIAEAAIQQALK